MQARRTVRKAPSVTGLFLIAFQQRLLATSLQTKQQGSLFAHIRNESTAAEPKPVMSFN
jgi:hypothetical protein